MSASLKIHVTQYSILPQKGYRTNLEAMPTIFFFDPFMLSAFGAGRSTSVTSRVCMWATSQPQPQCASLFLAKQPKREARYLLPIKITTHSLPVHKLQSDWNGFALANRPNGMHWIHRWGNLMPSNENFELKESLRSFLKSVKSRDKLFHVYDRLQVDEWSKRCRLDQFTRKREFTN